MFNHRQLYLAKHRFPAIVSKSLLQSLSSPNIFVSIIFRVIQLRERSPWQFSYPVLTSSIVPILPDSTSITELVSIISSCCCSNIVYYWPSIQFWELSSCMPLELIEELLEKEEEFEDLETSSISECCNASSSRFKMVSLSFFNPSILLQIITLAIMIISLGQGSKFQGKQRSQFDAGSRSQQNFCCLVGHIAMVGWDVRHLGCLGSEVLRLLPCSCDRIGRVDNNTAAGAKVRAVDRLCIVIRTSSDYFVLIWLSNTSSTCSLGILLYPNTNSSVN